MSGSSPLDAVPFARTLGIELASPGAEEVRGSLGWSEELCTLLSAEVWTTGDLSVAAPKVTGITS